MKNKRVRFCIVTVIGFALVFASVPVIGAFASVAPDGSALKAAAGEAQVSAASDGVEKLKRGRTYTRTLEGAASHKISWDFGKSKSNGTDMSKIYLSIDGQAEGSITKKTMIMDESQVEVSLASVNADTTLLCVEITEPMDDFAVLANVYRYDAAAKTLKLVGDAVKQNPFYEHVSMPVGLVKASGGKLYFRWLDPWAHSIGVIMFDAVFSYSDAGLKAADSANLSLKSYPFFKPIKTLTALKGFKAFTAPGGKNVALDVKKGDKVRPVKIKKFKAHRYYIQVKMGSKTGWIRASKSGDMKSMLFKESTLAV
jgi:hypothetical protein